MCSLLWQAVVVTCLSNLVYYGTAKTVVEKIGRSESLHFEEDTSLSCPETTDNLREPVYFTHPTDCQRYYICDSGFARLQQCQSGLHFNPSLKACDYPKEAGCDKAVSIRPKGKMIEDDSEACPISNSKYPVLISHGTDCNKFYICDNGSPHLQTCQAGLHFNTKLEACDYPEKAGCDKGISEKPKGKMIDDDEDSNTCPSYNSKYPVLLPHPTDCSKFYICDNGSPHTQTCQSGLHFNPKLKSCDFPNKAGCDKGISEKPKGKIIDDDEDSNTCPSFNSKHPVLLPHPTDCSKYYICDNGSPHTQTCQSGLHFNPKLKSCDFPNKAGCDKDTDTSNKPKGKNLDEDSMVSCSTRNTGDQSLLPHPTECDKFFMCDNGKAQLKSCQPGLNFNANIQACDYPENTDCGKRTSSVLEGVPSPFCPPVNGKTPIFYRHSSNCSVYYMCSHGYAYEFVCPARLHFNLRKKQCDYEDEARCFIMN